MPAILQADGTRVDFQLLPSRTLQVRDQSSEQASALPDGQRALTPIIAGTISSACIAIAWTVALVHILVKRYRRKRRYKELGQYAESIKTAKEDEERRRMEFIVPPDPAVLEGGHYPGERVVLEEQRWWKRKGRRRERASTGGELNRKLRKREKRKGKGKARLTSPKRLVTSPDLGPRSLWDQSVPTVIVEADEDVETMELRPQPYHRLSTIISVTDSERFRTRTPPTGSPRPSFDLPRRSLNLNSNEDAASKKGNGDVKQEEARDVLVTDYATSDRDDNPLVDHDSVRARVHKYPPPKTR